MNPYHPHQSDDDAPFNARPMHAYPSHDEERPLRLKELPEQDLPREKLMRHGRASLSDEELIALFLRTGLKGCNVLELSAKMKRTAGSLAALGRMEAHEIASLCKGIGPAKAATLAAVFELGQRAFKEELVNRDMCEASLVYQYLAPDMRYEEQENLVVLLLDAQHKLIKRVNVSKGTLSSVICHPRDIFREALRYNASSLILAHNHPSGDPKPSKADRLLTREIAKAGLLMRIRVHDHVIIGSPSPERDCPYFSFFDHGLMLDEV